MTNHTAAAPTSARATMMEAIEEARQVLARYLPPHVSEGRFMALANRAVLDNPDLWDCSTSSVLRSLGAAAASGLPIDGKMSSLIVRRPKQGKPIAVWDPSYRGMVYLALESGHVRAVEAFAVHARDVFEAELGTDPKITHRPYLAGDRGAVIASYAVAELKTGGKVTEVLGMADLERIRASSPAADKGPWGSWPDRMAMKSALRRLLKRLPAADIGTLGRAHEYVREIDDGEGQVYRAELQAPEHRAAPPEDLTALEARALAAIGEAGSRELLAETWAGIRSEFRAAGAEIPLKIEAAQFDRREALGQSS
ncbi:MAG TPA: recombinase RecT [Steroidobacteraceae bacterium]|jgi:recombination protein RecT